MINVRFKKKIKYKKQRNMKCLLRERQSRGRYDNRKM